MGKSRRRRNAASRRRWARRWRESGQSARAFAAEHGLALSSLSRWSSELREHEAAAATAGAFIEVTAAPKPAVPVPVRVVVGGVRLEFDQLPPAEYIVALGRAAC